ncbi:MAG: carboxypeptidase M32, partial [Caldilinea sp.]|nr:carboxypeptidase M32 [Caldilinea sp.]
AMLREARRSYERAVRIPAGFAAAFAEHMSDSFMAWIEARPANNFAAVQPYLQKTLDMSREMSHYLGTSGHVADPLIDLADQGFTVAELRPLFA